MAPMWRLAWLAVGVAAVLLVVWLRSESRATAPTEVEFPEPQAGRGTRDAAVVVADGEARGAVGATGLVPEAGARVAGDGPRSTLVAGRILDPLGQPADQALVAVRAAGGWWRHVAAGDGGRFELRDLPPGPLELAATAPEWAPSEPVELEAGRVAPVADLVLVLRAGARLTGEVRDALGQPARADVRVEPEGPGVPRVAATDAAGRFEVARLGPGMHVVEAHLRDESAATRSTRVEVLPGLPAHVVLGGKGGSIRLHGQVRVRGEPLAQASVAAFFAQSPAFVDEPLVVTVTDEHGTYEIAVERPGLYQIVVRHGPSGVTGEFDHRVPAERDVRLDLVVAGGTLRGRVRGPDGSPRSIGLVLHRHGGDGLLAQVLALRESAADHEGRFEYRNVAPGRYELRSRRRVSFHDGPCTAFVLDLEVREGELREVDVDVPSPGAVAGRVVDAEGRPVEGAVVHARDRAGRLLRLDGFARTDAAGAFEIDDLPRGPVLVFARTATAASRTVPAEAGGGARVLLDLEPATLLSISADPSDGPVPARVSVVDASGHEHAALRPADPRRAWTAGALCTLVGPLVPGAYVVEVAASDDRSTRDRVDLAGEAERELVLRFPH